MEETDNTQKSSSHLGKYDLIHEFSKYFTNENASTIAGIGEDAAAIKPQQSCVVMASKVFIENIHFDLTYFPLKYLGYKTVTVVLSDLLAMNAIPTQLMINVGISNRFNLKALNELLDGMAAGCENAHTDVAGLDITISKMDLVISLSALGECEPALLTTRKGAGENELICVSGDFGAAYAGHLLLEREKKVFETNPNMQPDFSDVQYLIRRQLRPEPRFDIIEALRRENIVPTAMTCVCDGLATAIVHICKASNAGCALFEEKIPMTELAFKTLTDLNIVHTVGALNGGEDYELMFTIKQADFEKIKEINNVSVIGYIKDAAAGYQLITSDNCQVEIRAQGFAQNRNIHE